MKILQICPSKLPLISTDGKIHGGAEKFCLELAKALFNSGHDVVSIVNIDTDFSKVSGEVKACNLRKKHELMDIVNSGNYDLVIYHLVGQSGLNTLTKEGIPVNMIWHIAIDGLGISKYGLFESISKNRNIGGKLIGVSSWIQERINREFNKTYNWCKDREKYQRYVPYLKTLKCDLGFIFQYISNPLDVLESNSFATGVSRCCNIRKPHLITNSLKDKGRYFLSIKDQEEEYFSKKIKPFLLENNDLVYLNLPHDQLLDKLREYKVIVNPCWFESAGYSIFEAASFGIPSILCTDDSLTHASMEFLPENAYLAQQIPKRGLKSVKDFNIELLEKVNSMDDSIEFRQSIQQYLIENFTEERVVKFIISLK